MRAGSPPWWGVVVCVGWGVVMLVVFTALFPWKCSGVVVVCGVRGGTLLGPGTTGPFSSGGVCLVVSLCGGWRGVLLVGRGGCFRR